MKNANANINTNATIADTNRNLTKPRVTLTEYARQVRRDEMPNLISSFLQYVVTRARLTLSAAK